MAEWIKGGGALPNIPDLIGELIETTYTFQGDALLLEPKKVIKARLGRSPDLADGLALTFAAEVAPRMNRTQIPTREGRDEERFDIFKEYLK